MTLLLALMLLAPPAAAEAKDAEKVKPAKVVSFDELIRAVKTHKGKVVVVDFWDDTCGECKKEFPGLVKLHRELGPARGVVCISVSLDEPEDKPCMERVDAFLRSQSAAFENFVLNEPVDGWTKKLGIHAVPAVFVFGRDGKLARAFKCERSPENPEGVVSYKHIEPYVLELLKR